MKKNHSLNRIGIVLVFLLFTMSQLISQNQSEKDWKLVKSSNDIDVYVQLAQCDGESVYLFKIENSSIIDRSVKLTIDIQSEPTFGPVTFEQKVLANTQSGETCKDSDLSLPRMMPDTEKTLNKIDVKLTIN